jgi:conjugative relaxase-like TrwC/TraI family protein
MIRMIQCNSADQAKAYFSDALLRSDYYTEEQELAGRIHGRLADRMGIRGDATREVFFALAENTNPVTKEQLTPRMKKDRISGYDINFHCPKSVSILHALSKDEHLLEAFQTSVRETMKDIEEDTKTRVRINGVYEDRKTGELAWAEFVHQTARPVEGSLPDPHLHAHCFVFNATWDDAEERFKAARFRDIKRDMPYYQARFHKRLSDQLIDLGYDIKKTSKSFEVKGVPKNVIDQFSKRTDEIGRMAKEKGITDPKDLDSLGARTRARKIKGVSMSELKKEWRQQIRALGEETIGDGEKAVRFGPKKEKEPITSKACVDHALLHQFERASVVQDRRLLGSAYQHGIGDRSVSLDAITNDFLSNESLIRVNSDEQILCTTKSILAEERYMVNLAREGQGKLTPLYLEAPEINLKGHQKDAVSHVLITPHRTSIIRGAAGVGKTTLMKEAVEWMEKAGKKVTVVAPSADASRGTLRTEGFENANTVSKLLKDKDLQEELKNQILWVDEAGLLGTQEMTELLEISKKQNARLILGGDTRQHSSVIRGDALRILNTVGGIKAAEVSKIYRQKNVAYRSAVEDLSKAKIRDAFDKLDGMNAIKKVDPLKPNDDLVNDYVATVKSGKSALVISPTHQQGDEVTDAIRKRLKAEGLIGKKEIKADRLSNLNRTEAEKGDWRNFEKGQMIQFSQNVAGIKRGSAWSVNDASEKGVTIIDNQGNTAELPMNRSKNYDVFSKSQIGLSKGDSIRITRNGFDIDKNRLNNGDLLQVEGVRKNGEMVLKNPFSKNTFNLKSDYGHLSHAHCITSHASQGKTVDEVFISQPAATFPGTDAKQFYVSVSRGRDKAHIYTDDKEQLLYYAERMGDRESAIELVSKNINSEEKVYAHVRSDAKTSTKEKTASKETKTTYTPAKDKDYEP